MYKKISKALLIISICTIFIIPLKISANEYTINDLIENGKSFDKKEITIKGEVIGESLKRDDHTWININDTTNAMGVYMRTEDANKVSKFGGYSKVGDTIDVKGTFNRACSEHGGDMDIHAKEVNVIKEGKKTIEIIEKNKIYTGIVSTVIVIFMGYIVYKKQK